MARPSHTRRSSKPEPTRADSASDSERGQPVIERAVVTAAHPEPEREQNPFKEESPATGITPSGAAGGRRM